MAWLGPWDEVRKCDQCMQVQGPFFTVQTHASSFSDLAKTTDHLNGALAST